MLKVEEVKRPLIQGEVLLVPCIMRKEQHIHDWAVTDSEYKPTYKDKLFITPIINHLHNDIENGQPEPHYHADLRFIKFEDGAVKNQHSKHRWIESIRIPASWGQPEYIALPVITPDNQFITPVKLISRSKLKHNCIHKGKCPHRGYPLSQEKSINGIITCPLHGLQFDAETKQVINFNA